MARNKIPKDLGIKMGSETQILWDKVFRESKDLIKQSENNLIIQRELLKLSEQKIEEEKAKIRKA